MGCCFCNCLIRKLGGVWEDVTALSNPKEAGLSTKAAELLDVCFRDLDVTKVESLFRNAETHH